MGPYSPGHPISQGSVLGVLFYSLHSWYY